MQQLQVMNFLNEVATHFPDAISLASGRPNPSFFDKTQWEEYQGLFNTFYSEEQHCSEELAEKLLCQYGPTAGVINGILQKHLQVDESIKTNPENIIVTNGCQEALTLLCLHELQQERDCMLTIDPSYIGFSGLLNAIGRRVEPIDIRHIYSTSQDQKSYFDWQYLREKVTEIKQNGIVPKAIYINPDFNNPLSYRLSLEERLSFLKVCNELEINVIEDNPYSRFDYTDDPVLSLKALDKYGIVYHIGSFSKTFCPSVRLGYLVVPEKQDNSLKALVSLKSLISVNTSSLPQSVVGGFLIKNDFSLSNRVKLLNLQYTKQRDAMSKALHKYFSRYSDVTWNIPKGGFFTVVNLPFDFSEKDVFDCAREEKVICMPIGFFSLQPEKWQGKVRLAFSNFDVDVLMEGVRRFSRYIEKRLLEH